MNRRVTEPTRLPAALVYATAPGRGRIGESVVNERARLFTCLMLTSFAAIAQQQENAASNAAEVALSNDTLELRYIGGGEQVGAGSGSVFTGAFFLSEARDIVLSGGLLWPANLNIDRLSLRVGPQLYAALLDEENNDIFTVTVGAEARFLLIRNPDLAIVGKAFYGPDILTFGSADSMTDLSARIEMGFGSQIVGFAGMRWFEFDLTDGSGEQTLMEEVFIGAQYRF